MEVEHTCFVTTKSLGSLDKVNHVHFTCNSPDFVSSSGIHYKNTGWISCCVMPVRTNSARQFTKYAHWCICISVHEFISSSNMYLAITTWTRVVYELTANEAKPTETISQCFNWLDRLTTFMNRRHINACKYRRTFLAGAFCRTKGWSGNADDAK